MYSLWIELLLIKIGNNMFLKTEIMISHRFEVVCPLR